MWLPQYLLVFVSISQLISDTHASLEDTARSRFWLPDTVKGTFAGRAARFEPASSSTCGCFGPCRRPAPMDSHQKEIAYFHQQWNLAHDKNKIHVVNDAVNHILRQPMTDEQQENWCRELGNVVNAQHNFAAVHASIIFAVNTLILKNRDNQPLTATLDPILVEILRKLPRPNEPKGQWLQELFNPQRGFSTEFSEWTDPLFNQLNLEPRLGELAKALNNDNKHSINKHLEAVIEEIFKDPPPKDVSAQTRVAALAVLFHVLKRQDANQEMAGNLVRRIILNPELFYVRQYEKTLLQHMRGQFPMSQDQDHIPGFFENM
ncbi:hypothetical protein PTTG_12713 [Puccinia triticina 1-1 BBBD Race 1]|uniref:Uncharacterized protein n=2 Tax=Puccinia triticina TaxID=208348 RepID=A0A180GVU1_PUCT1|nr:uncharacterized protein PtA15_6A374 [Puccinia triticina]OAV96880.1 hypothetical protein PTTG_12713 [Puccinia triticina 1-1 BBBD Race 1]WAQ85745.1 hypothetical protein PtA15_6A374 [Puccinia triticina]